MQHKYRTAAIVIGRTPHGEANITATLLTHDFGIISARAQGARKSATKMGGALQTLMQIDATVLRGKEGWRLAGTLIEHDYAALLSKAARERAARVLTLMDRLTRGETRDSSFFELGSAYLHALCRLPEESQDAAESLAALRLLALLGLDAGDAYGELTDFSDEVTQLANDARTDLISRINRGIAASGL